MPLPSTMPSDGRCMHCGDEVTGRAILGRCNTCYQYRYLLGRDRPAKTIQYAHWRKAGLKRCPTCHVVKPRTEYYGASGVDCKPCSREKVRRYNLAHAAVPRAAACARCGSQFKTHRPNARYCSTRCQKMDWKDRNQASAKAEYVRRRLLESDAYVADVDHHAIFIRDGWTCQLCGGHVDRELSFPHPHSASLDHILPLACGGTHEPANTQLAHLGCNAAKGSRAGLQRTA